MAGEQRRTRLSIDVSREDRRRIQIAAAHRDQSVREYVLEAVDARLREDRIDELASCDLPALTERTDPVLAERRKGAVYLCRIGLALA